MQQTNTLDEDYVPPAVTAEQRAAWQKVFNERIGGGPTALGFDRYFGIDVAGWPPFCLIENDRTIGVPNRPTATK
jgi:arylsulfatase A